MDQLEQLAKPRCSRRVPGGGIDHIDVDVDVEVDVDVHVDHIDLKVIEKSTWASPVPHPCANAVFPASLL